ncbi:MAG: diguanylate cyclase [Myxococcota bacterium]
MSAVRPRDRLVLFVVQGREQGKVINLRSGAVLVGRERSAQISLEDDAVSRQHARICIEDGSAHVEDLASLNGTFVNEQRIHEKTRIENGDQLRFGHNTIVKFWILDSLEQNALETLFELTSRDPLTRLYNRRYFEERLRSELSFARRHDVPLAVLLVDIDHFKRVNDEFGHPTGDQVLKLVASSMLAVTRPEDVLARYGGEEFILLARNTARSNAIALAERVRRAVQACRLPEASLQITLSAGVAFARPGAFPASAEALVAAADAALYEAKESGRDRVCVANDLADARASTTTLDTIPPIPNVASR